MKISIGKVSGIESDRVRIKSGPSFETWYSLVQMLDVPELLISKVALNLCKSPDFRSFLLDLLS